MCGQIAVANAEPRWTSHSPHYGETFKRLALDSPTPIRAQQSRQRISNGIHIGRNVESPPFEIVPRVHDNCQLARGQDLRQSLHQLCPAGSASQNDDHAALRA